MRRLCATLAAFACAGCTDVNPIRYEEMRAELSQKDRRANDLEDAIARRDRWLSSAQEMVSAQDKTCEGLRHKAKTLEGPEALSSRCADQLST